MTVDTGDRPSFWVTVGAASFVLLAVAAVWDFKSRREASRRPDPDHPVQMTVQVTSATTGRPIEGAYIWVSDAHGVSTSPIDLLPTDAAGLSSLSASGPCRLDFLVSHEGYMPRVVEEQEFGAGEHRVLVELEDCGTILVRAIDSAGRRLGGGYYVSAYDPNGEELDFAEQEEGGVRLSTRLTTGATGLAGPRHLADGQVELRLHRRPESDVLCRTTVTIRSGESIEAVLAVEATDER